MCIRDSVSDSLGEKSSFEGHLVKTTDGLEIFGDSAVMWFKVDEDLDVDVYKRQVDQCSRCDGTGAEPGLSLIHI